MLKTGDCPREGRLQAIRWNVDGVFRRTWTPADLPSGTRWVFEHPFFMLLCRRRGQPAGLSGHHVLPTSENGRGLRQGLRAVAVALPFSAG